LARAAVWLAVGAVLCAALSGCGRQDPPRDTGMRAPGEDEGGPLPVETAASTESADPLERCEGNMRALHMSYRVFCEQVQARLEPDEWQTTLAPFLRATIHDLDKLRCPEFKGLGTGYAINPPGASAAETNDDRILFYEGQPGGGADSLEYRHDGAGLVVTRGGTVLHVKKGETAGHVIDKGVIGAEAHELVW
jgi:hypothetical protein